MRSNNNEEVVLTAMSQEDFDMWIKAVIKLKEETERRRKDLEKKHKIQDTTAERATMQKAVMNLEEKKTSEFHTIDLGRE